MIIEKLKRHWARLAPKLIAFLATGVTSSGVLLVLGAFGIHLDATIATLLVGAASSTAAYIQRDNLLTLSPTQFSAKLLAFALTSITATGLVAAAGAFGIDLSSHAAAIGIVLTVVAGLVGYLKSDTQLLSVGPIAPSSDVAVVYVDKDADARRTEQAAAAALSADQARSS